LVESGYDVWMENWRASIDFLPNQWTLDQAALYDHPYAVKKIIEVTGVKNLKAIIHCQGSTSFMISLVAGLVPEVSNVISNAVSLHPVVPKFSEFKLFYMVPMVNLLSDYLNPQWGEHPKGFTAKFINGVVQLTHHECNNAVCKQVSFTYGSGFPALWRHENLNEETHEWLKAEFAHVPFTFYSQITRSVKKGHLVSYDKRGELPGSFVEKEPASSARISFFAGEKNQCFLPESQVRTFKYFDNIKKDYHSLNVIPDYSHLDIFMGKDAYKDVFPLFEKELNVH
jgi:hypothetical protein